MRTIERAIADLADDAEELSGRVRISAPEFGVSLLMPTIAYFAEHHPRVEIEVVADDAFVDIVAGGFDAGVRLHEAVPQDMIAIPISPDAGLVAVASPAYLAIRPPPSVPADLTAHRCIRFRRASGSIYRWEFSNGATPVVIDPPGMVTLNGMAGVVDAALQGVGIGMVWSYLVRDHLAVGRLVQLLGEWTPTYPGLHLYYPSRKNLPRAFAAFAAHIRGDL